MFFQALLLSAALETGFLAGGAYNYQSRNADWVGVGALYTDLEAYVRYEQLYVGGSVITYFTPAGLANFSPFQMTYIFDIGYETGGFKMGFEHSCYHPMAPYATITGNEIKPLYEGGYNKAYLRFEVGD